MFLWMLWSLMFLYIFAGKGRGRQVIAVARTADLIIIMLDAMKGEIQRSVNDPVYYINKIIFFYFYSPRLSYFIILVFHKDSFLFQ